MIKSFSLLCTLLLSATAHSAPVVIEVHGVTNTNGSIQISLFATAQSWAEEIPTSVSKIAPLRMGTVSVTIDLPPGTHAFFLYNDEDNNGELKKTWIGMPAEPYAFSNNIRLAMSKPSFDEMKFTVRPEGTKHTVTLTD